LGFLKKIEKGNIFEKNWKVSYKTRVECNVGIIASEKCIRKIVDGERNYGKGV
jgi:hypothetical protein